MDDDLLISYLAGECSQQEENQILEWIREDEANRRYLAELRALWYAARRPAEGDMSELLSGFAAVDSKISRREARKGSMRKVLPAAAGIAAVFLCGFLIAVFSLGRGRRVPPESFTWFNPDSTAMQITLPDRSTVWMGSNTSLTYTSNESGRITSLTGEAYFDVSKDPLKAFIVKTPDLRVKVYGTCFNVRSIPSETYSEVSLVEGSVSLSDNNERNIIFLTPGQQAKYVAQSDYLQVSEVPTDNLLLVRYGIESLKDMTIEEIVATLSQSFKVQLRISYCADAGELYILNYPKDASLEEVLCTVEMLSGSKIEIVTKDNNQ